MKAEINGKVYEQLPEIDCELCHRCVGEPKTEEADELCDKLGSVGCLGFIWTEVTESGVKK